MPHEITRCDPDDLDRAISDGATIGFVKVPTVPGRDRILGVTIVGDHAGEPPAEWTSAMKHGLGLNRALSTLHPYPTMDESSKFAAGAWTRARAAAAAAVDEARPGVEARATPERRSDDASPVVVAGDARRVLETGVADRTAPASRPRVRASSDRTIAPWQPARRPHRPRQRPARRRSSTRRRKR